MKDDHEQVILNFVVFVLVRYLRMKNRVEVVQTSEIRSDTGKLLAKT